MAPGVNRYALSYDIVLLTNTKQFHPMLEFPSRTIGFLNRKAVFEKLPFESSCTLSSIGFSPEIQQIAADRAFATDNYRKLSDGVQREYFIAIYFVHNEVYAYFGRMGIKENRLMSVDQIKISWNVLKNKMKNRQVHFDDVGVPNLNEKVARQMIEILPKNRKCFHVLSLCGDSLEISAFNLLLDHYDVDVLRWSVMNVNPLRIQISPKIKRFVLVHQDCTLEDLLSFKGSHLDMQECELPLSTIQAILSRPPTRDRPLASFSFWLSREDYGTLALGAQFNRHWISFGNDFVTWHKLRHQQVGERIYLLLCHMKFVHRQPPFEQ